MLALCSHKEDAMATVTIRNLDDAVMRKLKARAKANHRSLEAELREVLSSAVRRREQMRKFRARAERIAALTPDTPQTDSARLIREDRGR
jgi:plasmid stability protein